LAEKIERGNRPHRERIIEAASEEFREHGIVAPALPS